MIPKKYKQMLHKEVIKHYQKAPLDLENEFNKEADYFGAQIEGRR